jgi:hypothetical protein
VIAIAAVFAILLIFGFWRKLNPAFDKNAYYRDAAKLGAVEGIVSPNAEKDGGKAVAIPSDQAYQPEKGSD